MLSLKVVRQPRFAQGPGFGYFGRVIIGQPPCSCHVHMRLRRVAVSTVDGGGPWHGRCDELDELYVNHSDGWGNAPSKRLVSGDL